MDDEPVNEKYLDFKERFKQQQFNHYGDFLEDATISDEKDEPLCNDLTLEKIQFK
jgi:hypothetical protein